MCFSPQIFVTAVIKLSFFFLSIEELFRSPLFFSTAFYSVIYNHGNILRTGAEAKGKNSV